MVINLQAKLRENTGKNIKKIREQNLIPAVIYGPAAENKNLSVDYLPFQKVYEEAGASSLVDLKIDNQESIKVLIYDVKLDPVSSRFQHVDFYQIKEGQKLTATVELEFIGEAPAVKELNGNLVKNLDSLEIECLPKDLISKIEVDLSILKTFGDAIYVKDLEVPETVKVLKDVEEIVTKVVESKEEEEIKPVEEEELPEGAEEEAKEGEEGEKEGEAKTKEGAPEAKEEKKKETK